MPSVFQNLKDSMPPLIPAPQPAVNELGDPIPGDTQQQLQKVDQPQAKATPQVFKSPTPQDEMQGKWQDRLESDYQKDLHPWGTPENHPGVFGKIGHVLNALTGGPGRRGMEESGLEQRLNSLADQNAKNAHEDAETGKATAETGKTNAETPEVAPNAESTRKLQGAQVDNLESETNARDNPAEAPPEIHDTPMGLMAIDKKNATATPVTAHGTPIAPKLETSVVSGIVSHLDGKPHSYLVDKGGNKIADLGEHYERPITINTGEKPGELRNEKNDLLKAYQPTLDSAERMNVMTDAYEKAVKNHDQQAMLNLLANHLGMTMGLQKGARMTKDIIHEAQTSQPWLQGMAAKFDKDGYLSGVTLSPNQMRQMVNLGQERYAEDAKKSRSTAQYLGAKDDGPERTPGKATINYYLGLSNGDPQKAKQLATEDGWTVK